MVTGVLLGVGGLVGAIVLRRRRKAVLAGLNSSRPVFSVEPPARRIVARKREAL